MSEFLSYFEGRQIGWKSGRSIWWVLKPLIYRSELLGETVVIPEEFITDLASVPRLPLAWLIAGGRGTRSAVLHDYPCQFGHLRTLDGRKLQLDKTTNNDLFRESLLADPISGAGSLVAFLMRMGVSFGRGVWADMDRTVSLNPIWASSEAP